MGILIGLEKVFHEWPGKKVLEGVTIGVNEGDRIGIVGKNGDGKSTLLDVIARATRPDAGTVTYRNGIRLGFLGQTDALNDDDEALFAIVGDVPEYEWASDARVRSIMEALVADVGRHQRVGALSGGQRRRVDLARVLMGDWDVLVMDEPTNHLDVQAITWLAGHLRTRWADGAGALMVVTHDRWFLDEVCEHMWEVHDGVIDPFEGGYSAYVQQRVERQRQAAVMEERRQNVLRKELNWLAHGAKARSSKPKFRVDAARALVMGDPPLRNQVELRRLAVGRLGKQVIEMRDVRAGYGDEVVLEDVSWLIGPGERIGILGENGAGKSTLLKLMTGRLLPDRGYVKVGKSVRFGILSQDLDFMHERDDWRLSELVASYKRFVRIDGKDTSADQLLERLGFGRREWPTRICDLSGGQLRRLAIMCVLLEEPNVLVLDEPGNDLDTDMLAVLEDLLDGWPGTLLLVTHDRYLMERVTDDQYALMGGGVRHVPGGVDEYLALLGEQGAQDRESFRPCPERAQRPKAGLGNVERRELKKRQGAVSRRLERLRDALDELRGRMAATSATDYEALMALQAELDATSGEIAGLEDEWLELAERLDID
ncbi:ABC-F family ATP-binding cassette domain-containing protein [Olsenella massiliensis]|uniref:ABC-F family ATP-binding cassette domain-containing protein n=1 Tax=Olsenella massiliensis TaxID=1622075 RepID=UPI00071C4963|nr:ABC-F family ATP-binding cassette domain-containing protein [Olsenella massiliensis]